MVEGDKVNQNETVGQLVLIAIFHSPLLSASTYSTIVPMPILFCISNHTMQLANNHLRFASMQFNAL